jgi:serine/threonine protein phosphatase 1
MVRMATIAIGDIHGNSAALQDLLTQLRHEIDPGDTVVFLGDYIDRGADSKGCVELAIEFTESHRGKTIALCGNHEEWLLRTLRDYGRHSWLLGMDGFTTIRSYSAEAERVVRAAAEDAGPRLYEGGVTLPYNLFVSAMPTTHRQFFEHLVWSHRDEHGFYVHAGIDPNARLDSQTIEAMTWGSHYGRFPDDYSGDDVIVYGHRNNPSLDAAGWPHPRMGDRTIGLDTSHHGVVSAVRLPDRRVFQSQRYAEGV